MPVSYITALSDRRQRMMHRMPALTELAEKMTGRIYQNDNVILQRI